MEGDQPAIGDYVQTGDLLCDVVGFDGWQIALIPIGCGQAYYQSINEVTLRDPNDFCLLPQQQSSEEI